MYVIQVLNTIEEKRSASIDMISKNNDTVDYRTIFLLDKSGKYPTSGGPYYAKVFQTKGRAEKTLRLIKSKNSFFLIGKEFLVRQLNETEINNLIKEKIEKLQWDKESYCAKINKKIDKLKNSLNNE